MKHRILNALVVSLAVLVGMRQASAEPRVTADTLTRLVAAFNAHDLDAVMGFFADDCELLMPRGTWPTCNSPDSGSANVPYLPLPGLVASERRDGTHISCPLDSMRR